MTTLSKPKGTPDNWRKYSLHIYISDKGLVPGKQKETFYLNIKITLLKTDKKSG